MQMQYSMNKGLHIGTLYPCSTCVIQLYIAIGIFMCTYVHSASMFVVLQTETFQNSIAIFFTQFQMSCTANIMSEMTCTANWLPSGSLQLVILKYSRSTSAIELHIPNHNNLLMCTYVQSASVFTKLCGFADNISK